MINTRGKHSHADLVPWNCNFPGTYNIKKPVDWRDFRYLDNDIIHAHNDWTSEKAKIPTNGKNSIRRLSVGAIVKEKLLSHVHKQFSFPQEEPPCLQCWLQASHRSTLWCLTAVHFVVSEGKPFKSSICVPCLSVGADFFHIVLII